VYAWTNGAISAESSPPPATVHSVSLRSVVAGDNGVVFSIIQVATVLLAAVSMSMGLAHALEFPGKMRLDKDTYLAVQTIYYPGFTIGGAAEPASIIATLVLLYLTRSHHPAFWWTLVAFLALVVMHATFWMVTQPANKFWLKNQQLRGLGQRFFSTDPTSQRHERPETNGEDWKRIRDRWEYSHLARAVLSFIALVALTVAIAMCRRTAAFP
jgi:hypothetical protein